LALEAADRLPPSIRGLQFLFGLLGTGTTIDGVVVVLMSRRKR